VIALRHNDRRKRNGATAAVRRASSNRIAALFQAAVAPEAMCDGRPTADDRADKAQCHAAAAAAAVRSAAVAGAAVAVAVEVAAVEAAAAVGAGDKERTS
jgi:hypothetical protein